MLRGRPQLNTTLGRPETSDHHRSHARSNFDTRCIRRRTGVLEGIKKRNYSLVRTSQKDVPTPMADRTDPRVRRLLAEHAKGQSDFSGRQLRGADLSYSDLRNARFDGANLDEANLEHANIACSTFIGATLVHTSFVHAYCIDSAFDGANMHHAQLNDTYARQATFKDTNLREASLSDTHLVCAEMSGADLSHATIAFANLQFATLKGTNLTNVVLASTNFHGAKLDGIRLAPLGIVGCNFADVDLSSIRFEGAAGKGPSSVDWQTLQRTAQGLADKPEQRMDVELFLRTCGVEERAMEYFRSLTARPIEFYSCFISHSSTNKDFARKLHDALQLRGIRCWLDEKQILAGDDIREEIDRGIKLWDKVILCCSQAALERSRWVDREIDRALLKEERTQKAEGRRVHALVPLTLDRYVFDAWNSGKKDDILARKVADFESWRDHDAFETALAGLVQALRADELRREPPPKSRL